MSVKYETIIGRIFKQTKSKLEKKCTLKKLPSAEQGILKGLEIKARLSGIFQGFEKEALLKICERENCCISFIYPEGTFILKGSPFLVVTDHAGLSQECEDKIHVFTNIQQDETIENNFYYGFRQLKEVAVKALSPGINDPGTAILSLHALADLLVFRSYNFPLTAIKDSKGTVRIIVNEKTFDELFIEYFLAIWDYGKNDRTMRTETQLILRQIQLQVDSTIVNQLLKEVQLLHNSNITLQHEY